MIKSVAVYLIINLIDI